MGVSDSNKEQSICEVVLYTRETEDKLMRISELFPGRVHGGCTWIQVSPPQLLHNCQWIRRPSSLLSVCIQDRPRPKPRTVA